MVAEDCWQIFHIGGQDTGRCPPNLHRSKDGQAGNRHIFGRFIRVRPMNPIKRIHYYTTVQANSHFGCTGEHVPRRKEICKIIRVGK